MTILKVLAAIAFIVAFLGVSALICLQAPSPAPREHRQDEQNDSTDESRVANDGDRNPSGPVPANEKRDPDVDRSQGANKGDEREQGAAAYWTMIATIVTAGAVIAQAIIYLLQALLMYGALQVTQTAAKAAKKSADAAVAQVEQGRHESRAWLVLIPHLEQLVPDAMPTGYTTLKNAGKVPAAIEKMKSTIYSVPTPVDFARILREHGEKPYDIVENVVPPDISVDYTFSATPEISDFEVQWIEGGLWTLVVLVTVVYVDAIGGSNDRRESQCCFIHNHTRHGLIVNDKYNYMK